MKHNTKPIYLFSISSHPDAISINSLDITFFKPEIDFSEYDYLIITSKQASKALEQYDKELYIDKPALCISQQSAKSFEALGGTVLDIGKGYGDTLVDSIKRYSKEKRFLYLRAKEIASDFVEQSRKISYKIDEAIVYESKCSQAIQNVKVEENATLIFTSPSSVKCFLQKNDFTAQQTIIVIGKTTAKALPNYITPVISPKTTIQSCIDLVQKYQ